MRQVTFITNEVNGDIREMADDRLIESKGGNDALLVDASKQKPTDVERMVAVIESGENNALKFSNLFQSIYDSRQISASTLICGADPMMMELHRRKMQADRDNLVGSDPTSLELVAAERIVVCKEYLTFFETEYNRKLATISEPQDEQYQKRIDRAHKRLLSAMKALAMIQRLRIPPSVQVNIADKQICVQNDVSRHS